MRTCSEHVALRAAAGPERVCLLSWVADTEEARPQGLAWPNLWLPLSVEGCQYQRSADGRPSCILCWHASAEGTQCLKVSKNCCRLCWHHSVVLLRLGEFAASGSRQHTVGRCQPGADLPCRTELHESGPSNKHCWYLCGRGWGLCCV
jgi:hypothetical protein